MNKFEKAVGVSVLSAGISLGAFLVESHISHENAKTTQECYKSAYQGEDKKSCLDLARDDRNSTAPIKILELAGLLGCIGAGFEAYEAFKKEPQEN